MSTSRFSQVLFCAATVLLIVGLIGVRRTPQTGGRTGAAANQTDPCAAPANRIIAENCKPGNPSTEWDINGVGDQTIVGFPTDISFNVGETARFKVKTDSARYRVDVYRTGWYGGLGRGWWGRFAPRSRCRSPSRSARSTGASASMTAGRGKCRPRGRFRPTLCRASIWRVWSARMATPPGGQTIAGFLASDPWPVPRRMAPQEWGSFGTRSKSRAREPHLLHRAR